MLPHIRNSQAGVNREDPMYKNLFEVYFTLPAALQTQFGSDVGILTEQVQKIGGLASIDKGVEAGQQKFMGTDRSYLNSKPDSTHHELDVTCAINLRNGTDNYVYKLLRAWNRLGYNMNTGETVLKKDYVADWVKIVVANRAGDIFKEMIFHDVMLVGGLQGFEDLDYNSTDVVELSFKFISDWCDDTDA